MTGLDGKQYAPTRPAPTASAAREIDRVVGLTSRPDPQIVLRYSDKAGWVVGPPGGAPFAGAGPDIPELDVAAAQMWAGDETWAVEQREVIRWRESESTAGAWVAVLAEKVPAGPDVANLPAASEPPDRPGTTDSDHRFPLVLVSQAPRPLPPARAELREQHPTRPGIVKVVYEASRTAAWIDRSRIIESADPAPESPQDGGNGGGVTRDAGAPAPRPVHVTLTQREADLLTTYAADILDEYEGEDRDTLLAALHKVGDALIAARRMGEATS